MHKMDSLIYDWTQTSGHNSQIGDNAALLRFLDTCLYCQYQPFPEKPPFWDRLFDWLDGVTRTNSRQRKVHQQSLFNFIPALLFVGEKDLIASYRAAYTGTVCRWLLDQTSVTVDDPALDSKLADARKSTWFGSLAGMDINTFCRVNGIFGQSYRPEFRFIAEFCNRTRLSHWLRKERLERIVIVEDIVGTGQQLTEALPAIKELGDFPILFVPLFIAPEGLSVALDISTDLGASRFLCEPLFVLPDEYLVKAQASTSDSAETVAFRKANETLNFGRLGFGDAYGTLVLTYANCPDNVPPIFHERATSVNLPLFPRASREG